MRPRNLFNRRILVVERQCRATLGAERQELAIEFGLEPFPAERLDQEFQAVALLVLVVAEAMEHAHDRFGNVEHFPDGQELVEHVTGAGHRRRSTSDGHREAAL